MLKNNCIIKTDIGIIGAGPAGLAAGIYGAQDKNNFLLLDSKDPCWFLKESINSHYYVDGYTGVEEKTTGSELKNSFLKHYKRLGGSVVKEKIVKIKKDKNEFIIKTESSKIVAKSIILATGTVPITLKIRNSDKFSHNIHYYCTIDGKKYIGKSVFVIGGRNSGAVTAIYLHDLGCKVTLVELKDTLQSKEKYIEKIKERGIKTIFNAEIENLKGDKNLSSIIIKTNNAVELEEYEADAIFVCIGRLPNLNFLDLKLEKDREGYIIVNCFNETSSPGIFAAGDLTCKLKQVISACGDGANAYYFAKKYLKNLDK